MARRAKPNDADGGVINVPEAKAAVKDAVAQILKHRTERKEINAAIAEQRARCKNLGVPPAALDLAIRMKESDPEDREKHDTGYLLARDALGLKIQADLFDDDDGGGEAEAEAEKPRRGRPPASSAMQSARAHLSAVPEAVN